MRLDRLITLGLVHQLKSLGNRMNPAGDSKNSPPSLRRLPILMYHSVSEDRERGISSYYRVCVSPRRFSEQMSWLAEAGYKGVSLTEGLAWLNKSVSRTASRGVPVLHAACPLPNQPEVDPTLQSIEPVDHEGIKPVAITFDDGFLDFHSQAFPVLQQHGFGATMYLATGFMNGESRSNFKGRPCMNWREIRELATMGVEFGSHTVNHPKLVDLGWRDIELELTLSKEQIQQQLGARVTTFAYPFAFPAAHREFSKRLADVLSKTGYENCVTTLIGTARPESPAYSLPRLPCNQDDDCGLFMAKLKGSYDWMRRLQSGRKSIGRHAR